MKKLKKVLCILIIVIILSPFFYLNKSNATNGDAKISGRDAMDFNGNSIRWKSSSKTIWEDDLNHYNNLYCIDAGQQFTIQKQ